MFSRRKVLALGAASLPLSGCGKRDWVYRYRLSVYAETSEGLKQGAAVRQIRQALTPPFPISLTNPNQLVRSIIGQAAIVDLGSYGLLFALLVDRFGQPDKAAAHFPDIVFHRTGALKNVSYRDTPEFFEHLNARAELIPDEIPFLAHFGDLQDPRSVRQLYPDAIAANTDGYVKKIGAFIEMTTAPVTTGIEKTLPWLSLGYPEMPLTRQGLGRPMSETRVEQRLTHNAFLRGTPR